MFEKKDNDGDNNGKANNNVNVHEKFCNLNALSLAKPTMVKSETLKNVDQIIDLNMKIAEETIKVKDLDIDKASKQSRRTQLKFKVQGLKVNAVIVHENYNFTCHFRKAIMDRNAM